MLFVISCVFALVNAVAESGKIESVEVDEKLAPRDIEFQATPPPLPRLLKLIPVGGTEGSRIIVVGVNLGDNPKKLFIEIEKPTEGEAEPSVVQTEGFFTELPESEAKQPGRQAVIFEIPRGEGLVAGHCFSNSVKLRLTADGGGSRSHALDLSVIADDWKWKVTALAILLVVVLLALLALAMKRINLLPRVFLDKKSNTYSLSKFQAFSWTVVFLGSYFYVGIGSGLILGKGEIPDFNPSLLWLMGISYGGLLVSSGASRKWPKKDLEGSPRSWSNLIMEGGEISIPRLQLVGFSITAIILYLYNLTVANVVANGLPDVPPTLLGLLGVSQGGYLTGKVVGGKVAVNYVLPRRIPLGTPDITLAVSGSGFSNGTKALLQDHSQLIDVDYASSNLISIPLPAFSRTGWKQLILIPLSETSFQIDDVLEVVDPRIENVHTVSTNPKQLKVRLRGFDLESVGAQIDQQPATVDVVDQTTGDVTLEVKEPFSQGQEVKISSADGLLEVISQVP